MPSSEAVDELNELNFINGEIWANIWHSDRIARDSTHDPGRLWHGIDLTGQLLKRDA